MRRLPILLLVLGCTTEPAVPAPPAPTPVTTVVEMHAGPPGPTRPGALGSTGWTYFTVPGPLSCGMSGDGVGADCDMHLVGDPRTFGVADDDPAPRLILRADGVTTSLELPLREAAGATSCVLGWALERAELHVACIDDDEVVVLVRDEATGAPIREMRTAMAGRTARGVQLGAGARDAILVHVLADVPWTALFDAGTGALADRADAGVALASLDPAPHAWTTAGTSATLSWGSLLDRRELTASHGRVVLERPVARGVAGERFWSAPIESLFGCASYALADLDAEIAVLHHCGGSSGAGLVFLDAADGSELAASYPGTIGTIGHSMYHSTVGLAVDGGRVWLHGVESAGSYVCAVDAATHRTLACLIARS